jgi:chemotaxis family two-component system sensor kinase Cph1
VNSKKTPDEMSAEELREYTENKLADILSVLSDVALGDLTVEASVESEDIFGSVAMGVNAMIKGLCELKAQDAEKTLLLEKTNQELEDFVYIVSHDLKAPLRAMTGFAQFLREDYYDKLDEQGRDYIRRIVEGADRMQQLINDLLELSRIGRHRNPFSRVDAGELIQRTIQFVHPPQDVKILVSGDMPTIMCDEVRLQQVFANLVTNAIKYNDKKEREVEISWVGHPEDGYDEFIVRDNGIGIEEKHLEVIFRIFQRLHSKDEYGGGTGIGLNIVKKIIEQHGGNIWVESVPGQGSAFHFTIRCFGEDTSKEQWLV